MYSGISLPHAESMVVEYVRCNVALRLVRKLGGRPTASTRQLGIRVEETSHHGYPNKEPSFVGNQVIKQKVSQNGHWDLVEGADNGIRRRPSHSHTLQSCKIQKESHQPSKHILEIIIIRMDCFRLEKQLNLTHIQRSWNQKGHAKHIVVKDHSKLGQVDRFCRIFHVQNITTRAKAVQSHPKETLWGNVDILPRRRYSSPEHNAKGHNDQSF